MNRERIIRLLEEQLGFARAQNLQLSGQLSLQAEQLSLQAEQIAQLRETIQSLEQALKQKDISPDREKAGKKAFDRLLADKSEKVFLNNPPCAEEQAAKTAHPPKERGNNNARRKVHFNLETIEYDVYPREDDFDPETSRRLSTEDSIRYEYLPCRFIKHIYHRHYYVHRDSIVYGELPATPLLNSSCQASFLAGILQLRYIYSMPVERIVKYFTESGFELPKAIAHDLIKKRPVCSSAWEPFFGMPYWKTTIFIWTKPITPSLNGVSQRAKPPERFISGAPWPTCFSWFTSFMIMVPAAAR